MWHCIGLSNHFPQPSPKNKGRKKVTTSYLEEKEKEEEYT
jgi:hypothetical protein